MTGNPKNHPMTNPIPFLKTRYANIIADQHFGEIFTGSEKVFGAKVVATIIGLVANVNTARYNSAEAC